MKRLLQNLQTERAPLFNDDPQLYVEFGIIMILFGGSYVLYKRTTPGQTDSSVNTNLNYATNIAIFLLFGLFFSLTSAVAAQGIGYLGNMLLTSLPLLVLIMGSFRAVATRLEILGYTGILPQLSDVLYTSGYGFYVPLFVAILDDYRITGSFELVSWINQQRVLPFVLYALLPSLTALSLRARIHSQTSDNFWFTQGLCFTVAYASMCLCFLDAFAYKFIDDLLPTLLLLFVALSVPLSPPSSLIGSFAQKAGLDDKITYGFDAGAHLIVLGLWVYALARPIFGVAMNSFGITHWFIVVIVIIWNLEQRLADTTNNTQVGVATLLSVSLAMRVSAGLITEITDFGLLATLVAGIAGAASLYVVQFS